MASDYSEIFVRPHRLPVVNALRKAVQTVLDCYLPEQNGLSLEIGCGSGFFYKNLVLDRMRPLYVGIDRSLSSLSFFNKQSPEAKILLGDSRKLPLMNNSVEVVTGLSAYPLFIQSGTISEVFRVLRPGGRLIVFQDSGLSVYGVDITSYDQMKRVETVHKSLVDQISGQGFHLVSGEDPMEAAVVSPIKTMQQRIPAGDLDRMAQGSILIAFSSDLGINRLHQSFPKEASQKLRQVIKDFGPSKALEGIKIQSGRQALEYTRIRFIVAEKM